MKSHYSMFLVLDTGENDTYDVSFYVTRNDKPLLKIIETMDLNSVLQEIALKEQAPTEGDVISFNMLSNVTNLDRQLAILDTIRDNYGKCTLDIYIEAPVEEDLVMKLSEKYRKGAPYTCKVSFAKEHIRERLKGGMAR